MESHVRSRNLRARRQFQREHYDTKEESSDDNKFRDLEQNYSSITNSREGNSPANELGYHPSHDSCPGLPNYILSQSVVYSSPFRHHPKRGRNANEKSQDEKEEANSQSQGSDTGSGSDFGFRSHSNTSVSGRKPTSARQKKKSTQVTISDDRSCGSEFEHAGRLLAALKRGNRASKESEAAKSLYPIITDYGISSDTITPSLPPLLRESGSESFSTILEEPSDTAPRNSQFLAQLAAQQKQEANRRWTNKFEGGSSGATIINPTQSIQGITMSKSRDMKDAEHRGVLEPSDTNAFNNTTAFIDPQSLGIPGTSPLSMEALRSYIYNLQQKGSQFDDNVTFQKPKTFLVVHRIIDNATQRIFFDRPRWVIDETNAGTMLNSDRTISSLSLHLARHPEIIFLVYRDYRLADLAAVRPKVHEVDSLSTVDHTCETVEPLTDSLREAMAAFADEQGRYLKNNGGDHLFKIFTAPYLPVYHSRDNLSGFSARLEDEESLQFDLLTGYIFEEYGDKYETVDSLIKCGKITNRFLQYLFKPGDVLVEGKHQFASGYMCNSWLQDNPFSTLSRAGTRGYTIKAWSWIFQGFFSQKPTDLLLSVDGNDESEKIIDELNVRPLSHVTNLTRDRMRLRGETFWKCRVRRFVSYHEDESREFHHSGDDRYMIDLKMYRELHKKDKDKDSTYLGAKDDLGDGALEKDEPPNEQFLFTLPLTIKGYNLKRKKWLDLEVYQIGDVVWNTEAFEGLVLDRKTKRLIQALVSNQVEAEKGTDLISGKGNGLILLLHGGPGTGKTLTAESVAEIAKRPLYPVTCGDIGTQPEDVENYLESVLHLGKTWECVVLLDEADVFLEQRSLEDLRRNALVSVFLRVLEYYDGILILTSNRVGTFDEAFKSRIQLALHYPNLSQYSRTKIWGNFIQRLEKMNEQGIDFDDLNDHIEKLAEYRMNGREIRNVITTARLSAQWEAEILNFKFLEGIIKTTGRFNLYLEKLNNGYSQDKLAEEEGLRLAGAIEDGAVT
jgi:hypothetical protein